jgi:hypothetical protein
LHFSDVLCAFCLFYIIFISLQLIVLHNVLENRNHRSEFYDILRQFI